MLLFMKHIIVQLVIAIVLTAIGLFIGFAFSIEEPHYKGEFYSALVVSVLNLLWLIPYSITYYKSKSRHALQISFFVYLIIVTPTVVYWLYNTPFDSTEWKHEVKNKVHTHGNMVSDILDNKRLVGSTLQDVTSLLGNQYDLIVTENDTTLSYVYSNQNIFDGCNKLNISIKNRRCVKAQFGGCD